MVLTAAIRLVMEVLQMVRNRANYFKYDYSGLHSGRVLCVIIYQGSVELFGGGVFYHLHIRGDLLDKAGHALCLPMGGK